MKKRYKVLIGTAVLLIILRLILPYAVLHYANIELAGIKGYYGHIDSIDISLYRGAYIINNIYLNKIDPVSMKQIAFFRSRSIDLSVEWGALFQGAVAAKLNFDSPVLIFTKDKVELDAVTRDTGDYKKLLMDFMPLRVNRFEVTNGAVHYTDASSKPKVDISLKQVHILAFNLLNVTDDKVELPSVLTAQASVYEGTFDLNMKMDALADNPTFDLNAEMKNINLVFLHDFLLAYGNFDVNRGVLSVYMEMAAKGGSFKGYVKPVITRLDVVGSEDKKDSVFHKVWESLVGAAGIVLKNSKEDQLATKIRMEGSFRTAHANTFDVIWEALRNGFIQATVPRIDNEVNINSVKPDKPAGKK